MLCGIPGRGHGPAKEEVAAAELLGLPEGSHKGHWVIRRAACLRAHFTCHLLRGGISGALGREALAALRALLAHHLNGRWGLE